MDTKKVVIVLLVIAIVFSVLTLLLNFGGFDFMQPRAPSNVGGSGVSVTVLPNLILGVLYG